MEIKSTKDAADHGLKILVHGPSGVGKTRLSSTTKDLDFTLILSAEAGLLSLRDYDIDYAVVKSIDDMRTALKMARSDDFKYRWLILDSISEIAEICLAAAQKDNRDGRAAYGDMADIMFAVIRGFRDLEGINVVMTCKSERVVSEGALIWTPMLPGKKLEKNISYLFDEVFAFRANRDPDTGNVTRRLQTANDGLYECKDRSDSLDFLEKPDLFAIQQKILNKTQPQNEVE